MPRGGKRANAGRPPGLPNRRTVARREIADKALAAGITPLEVMLDNMRFFHEAAQVALQKLLDGTPPVDVVAEHEPHRINADKPPSTVDAVALILKLRERSQTAANDAAPYLHSRLAPIEAKGPRTEDSEVPLVERLKRYATVDAIEQSGGKVVELKVSDRPAPTGRSKAKAP